MSMTNEQTIKSTCTLCLAGCGVLIQMKDGKPVKVQGDREHPANRGALCVKGAASLEYLYSPHRLLHPLKRIGDRGEGKWQRISWDEALTTIITELNEVKHKYGAEAVAFVRGGAKGYQDSYLARFANVFGSPNVVSTSNICFMPRMYGSLSTYGFMSAQDYDYPPACIVLWGFDGIATNISKHNLIMEALEKGTRLIVIDPADTVYARQAEIWAKPRPSADLALALSSIHIIIEEGLYDKDFVAKWTVGFDKLKEHVRQYAPEKVAEITWVPADTIRQIARLYATSKSACIELGNGIDTNINSFQTARAVAILRAISGNIGRPGGELEWSGTAVMPQTSPELTQQNAISMELRAKRIGGEEHILPNYYSALPQKLVKAMLTSKPYPMRAAYIPGAAMLHSYNNSKEVYRALKSLDFIAVAEYFMIPTAELADIVLPVTTYMEMDSIHECKVVPVVSIVQKVAQVGECWSDLKIYIELAKKMGLRASFWDDEKDTLDFLMKPAGLTFDEFRKVGIMPVTKQYHKYQTGGFNTPSGKVELYSEQLAKWGFDPVPTYREPPESPFSAPELMKEYPLLITNWKVAPYLHAAGRQIPSLRNSHPEPLVVINSSTAKKLGVTEGEWVHIETKRGRIKQKATLSKNIDPRVVISEHGWWFPEKDATSIHGWAESNMNVLTDNVLPYGEIGSTTLKGYLCRVSKAV